MVKVVTRDDKKFEFTSKLERFALNSQYDILKIEVCGGSKYYFPISNISYFVSDEGHPFWEKL